MMPGTIVQCTNLDDIRIEVVGESRSVRVPASLVLAMYHILKVCHYQEEDFEVVQVEGGGCEGWQAQIDMGVVAHSGVCASPHQAIADLADKLMGRNL